MRQEISGKGGGHRAFFWTSLKYVLTRSKKEYTTMIKNILSAFVVCMVFSLFLYPHHQAHSQGWSDFTIRSLPDSSLKR